MGTISPRKRSDGTVGYTAQIRLKRAGKIVHTEAQTFDRRQSAAAWLKRREAELDRPGALEALKAPDPTLAEVVDRYLAESQKAIGRTKAQVLAAVKRFDIAALRCSEIRSEHIVAFAREVRATPQTVGNYVSHLGAIFAIAKPAWGFPLDPQAMKDAHVVLRRLGVTAKSGQRDRRPTLDEIDRLMAHFGAVRQRRPSSLPMQAITAFAIFSTRRQEEITRLRWADLDEAASRILVRDLKNPGEKIGNHQWCELPPEALAIIQAQPRRGERIFPYSTDAVCMAFIRACKLLDIEDLHFHDLRREGASRLFEMGRSIPQVAAVTAHRSWTSLKIYAHLRQTGDRWAGWRWLPAVTASAAATPR